VVFLVIMIVVEANTQLPVEVAQVAEVTRVTMRVELPSPEGDLVVEVEGEGRVVEQIWQQDEAGATDLIAVLASLTQQRRHHDMLVLEVLASRQAYILPGSRPVPVEQFAHNVHEM
jgi:hypothetical protein